MIHALFQTLLAPADPFIGHPELAYVMAIGFAILLAISVRPVSGVTRGSNFIILVANLLWGLFGWNEQRALQMRWEIRVDLLFLWPPVLVTSVAAAWLGLRRFVRRKSMS